MTLLNCFFYQLLCADPSPGKIPSLKSYIAATLQGSVFSAKTQSLPGEQVTDRLGWLLPEELNALTDKGMQSIDWEKVIPSLLQRAAQDCPWEGEEEEEERIDGRLKLTTPPLGLQNRWRIWKILQAV